MMDITGKIDEFELEELIADDQINGGKSVWDIIWGAVPTVPCTKSCNK